MELPVRRFAVAVVLPEPVRGRLEELQRRHGLPPWQPAIPLHITLVSPFTARMSADSLAPLLDAVAARLPFPVALDGFDRFDNDQSVLYARVVPGEVLARLADDALAALSFLHGYRRHPFVPHVSIADRAPRGIVDGYEERLAQEPFSAEFICDRFSLLRLDEDARRWDVLRDFPFTP